MAWGCPKSNWGSNLNSRIQNRIGDHDETVGVALGGPAGDHRQARQRGIGQVSLVSLALPGCGEQDRQEHDPIDLVVPARLGGLQAQGIPGGEFPQVPEDRAVHVVVSIQDDVAGSIRQGAGQNPTDRRAGRIPFGGS